MGEGTIVALDVGKALLAPVHQIHLVDGNHHMPDTQHVHDAAVAAGLGQHALAGINQDHCQFGAGGTGGHIAGVLLMAGRIGNDELAPGGTEKTIGHIDSDALFAFRLQAVQQQGVVQPLALGAMGA